MVNLQNSPLINCYRYYTTIMKINLGHIAAFSAYAIFGFNIIVCKNIATSNYTSPMGIFCLRAIGATILFWFASIFAPSEKIDKKDYIKIFFASLLGLFITQITFLEAIAHITPFDCSIISTLTPIYTMFIAAIFIKEPITIQKVCGVLLSFFGILFLLYNGVRNESGTTEPIGVILMLINGLSFSLYLGIFRPLITKYSVVTFMKWMFLFSLLIALPFSGKEIATICYTTLPVQYILELLYLIIFSTFIAYFLIPLSQKKIRPTLVGMYSYVQPIIATIMSIYLGLDTLSCPKILAAIAVITGVVIVNKSKSLANKG